MSLVAKSHWQSWSVTPSENVGARATGASVDKEVGAGAAVTRVVGAGAAVDNVVGAGPAVDTVGTGADVNGALPRVVGAGAAPGDSVAGEVVVDVAIGACVIICESTNVQMIKLATSMWNKNMLRVAVVTLSWCIMVKKNRQKRMLFVYGQPTLSLVGWNNKRCDWRFLRKINDCLMLDDLW